MNAGIDVCKKVYQFDDSFYDLKQGCKSMKKHAGSLCVLLSAVLFGTMPLLATIAYDHGSNAYTVAFGRFLFGSMMLLVIIFLLPGCSVKIPKKHVLELLKLSVSYALMPILLYTSYNYIDSGMATTLHFTYPVAVMLIMVFFYKNRIERKQVICAILCLIGLSFLLSPDGQPSVPGVLLSVGSGIIYAIYIVLLGKSKAKELHPLTLAFWLAFFSAIEIGAVALVSRNLVFSLDGICWTAEAVMALFTTVFALVLFQRGLFLCGEVKASLLSTFEPLTGIVIGVVVFGEIMTLNKILGMMGILVSAMLLVLPLGQKAEKKET